MMQSRTCQFKVATTLPDFARREIRQIVVKLNELQVIERYGEMVARGTIWRELRYMEKGRLRKANDRLQFETMVAENQPGIAAFVKVDLKPEWFTFQNVPHPGGQPVLEQAFRLTFWWLEEEDEPEPAEQSEPLEEYQTLTLNRILSRGMVNRVVNFPVLLPEGEGGPGQCRAELQLDSKPSGSLAIGVLKGWLVYGGQAGNEIEFEQSIGLFIDEIPGECGSCLGLAGSVTDISWQPGEANKNIWNLTVKVELTWVLVREEALECLVPSEECPKIPSVPIRISSKRSPIHLQFQDLWTLPGLKGRPGEVKAVVKRKREVLTKRGVLLTAVIGLEMFYDDPAGTEAYQEWEVEFNQLVTDGIPVPPDRRVGIDAKVGVELENALPCAGQLQVDASIHYEVTLVEERDVEVVTSPASACTIMAKVRLDNRKFTAPGEACFRLRSRPRRVDTIQTEISHLELISGPGWLKVCGELDIAVLYGDWARHGRMDLFTHCFQEDFIWEGLQPKVEVQSKAELLFDSYEMVGGELVYRYLLEFNPESFRREELGIVVKPEPVPRRAPLCVSREVPKRKPVRFWMEQEVALESGPAVEIAAERTRITQFRCQDVGNALLVEGRLNGELEYWDRQGFLRREALNFPFWNFVPLEELGRIDPGRLVPQIRKCTYRLLDAWLWQKSSVKVTLEVELVHTGGEENGDQGPYAKPD